MALVTLDKRGLDVNPDILGDKVSALSKIFEELQGLKLEMKAGAAAATNIAISGIATDDTLVKVWQIDFTLAEAAPNVRTWVLNDRLSEASISSAGNIQLSTTNTTGAILLIVWFDKVA